MTVFELVAKLTLDSSEYESDLKKQSESGSKLAGAWGKVGKAVKVGAVAIGAASTAVGALTKKSIDAYAEYEQLAGGIKKLFGEKASADLLKYAEQGYKSAGLSANKYMDTAIGFSGALLKSLQGDTKKGAEMTNMAIQDMSDMANTYGKTVEEVSETYTSLARGNYQTLDNLFGGMFAGTKTGLKEMLKYAEDYRASMGETVSYSADSYADIVSAIHDVSKATGVYGTTMHEAATTIQGSFNMTKAAWNNLIAGFANPDADMGQLMDNLVVAIVGDKNGEGLLNQLIPAVQRAVEGIGEFIQKAVPMLANRLPSMIQSFLPVVVKSLVTLVASIIQALPSIFSTLVSMMPEIIDTVVNGLVDAIISSAPKLKKEAPRMVKALATGLLGAVSTLLSAGKRLISALGTSIASGLTSAGSKALALAKKIPQKIKSGLGSLVSAGGHLIDGLWSGIKSKFNSVVSRVKALAAKLPAAVRKVLGIASPSKVFMEVGRWIPEGLALGIEKNMGAVQNAADAMADATLFEPTDGTYGMNSGTVSSNTVFNIYATPNQSAREIAEEVKRLIIKDEAQRRMAWV